MARTFFLLLTALAATGCVRADRIREDLRTGRTRGAYVEDVPFHEQKPDLCGPAALSSLLAYWGRPSTQDDIAKASYHLEANGVFGFDLWLYARREGLVSLEAPGLEDATIDRLLGQGVPVLLNLGSGLGLSDKHYVLVVGHDRDRELWILQDGHVGDRVVSEAWLSKRRVPTKGWGLVVFPPAHPLAGLGARLHFLAAERAEELKRPDAALRHLEEARLERGPDPVVWFRIGRLEKIMGRTAEAEKAYREAMRLDPASPDAMNNLALLLSEDPSRLDEAEGLAKASVMACGDVKDGARRLPYALDTLGLIARKRTLPWIAKDACEAALLAIPPSFPAEMRADLEREIRRHRDAP